MIILPNVDLVTVNCVDPYEGLKALAVSSKNIKFNSVKLISNFDPKVNFLSYEFIKIDKLNLIEYNLFQLIEINKYITADYMLNIETDGFVINSNLWDDRFLDFDYIGAPWPPNWNLKQYVGNSGFSIRSKKFLDISNIIIRNNMDVIKKHPVNFDITLCNELYDTLIKFGIKFADRELAYRFSKELFVGDLSHIKSHFGFHGKFQPMYKLLLSNPIREFLKIDFSL